MKRLSINHISAASIRANRKTYISLAFGIFLAVFLATTVSICCRGILEAQQQGIRRMVGDTDCVIYDDPNLTDEQLRQSGLFQKIGREYVLASVKDSDVYLGYADEEGTEILCTACVEGRMPEKAGEIAVEQNALEKLRLEAGLGDTVTWKLLPVDGTETERSFTIVGILNEQSVNLDPGATFRTTSRVVHWPSVILSTEESFPDGRAVIHRVTTYAPLVTFTQITKHHSMENALMMAVSRAEGRVTPVDSSIYDRDIFVGLIGMMLILGGSLLLCTGVGIASAMESVLAAKTEEIGMLRAVGATRRQIRSIFGRDAWLLGSIALPLGLGLGVGVSWLLCRIRPEEMCFAPSAWLLLPIVGVSVLCILLSSALPLWRASRQLPMGVLRDTALLRKASKFKSRKDFRSTRLIAGRQLRLHPWRQAGAALMVAAALLCSAMVGEIVYDAVGEFARSRPVAFTLYPAHSEGSAASSPYRFADLDPQNVLSEADLAQLRTTPHVEMATIDATLFVELLLPEGTAPAYFTSLGGSRYTAYDGDGTEDSPIPVVYNILNAVNGGYLSRAETDPVPPEPDPENYDTVAAWNEYMTYEQMRAAVDALSLPGRPVSLALYVVDFENVDYSDRVAEGKINIAAIDAGEQLLVYAPTIGVYNIGSEDAPLYLASSDERWHGESLYKLENDYFHAGMTLDLAQILCDGTPVAEESYNIWKSAYSQMEYRSATPTVGAVLAGLPIKTDEVCLMTTEKGARAMGFDLTHLTTVTIYLDGDVDRETEEALVGRISRIGMRGDMKLRNWLQFWREEVDSIRKVSALFGGMMLLFFTVAVAMQVSGAARRIRSDSRMIGTLRAVGADEKALLEVYRLPMILTTAAGTVLAVILYIAVALWIHALMADVKANMAVMVVVMAALGALCALCCLAGLRMKLKSVLDQSIVENIREL